MVVDQDRCRSSPQAATCDGMTSLSELTCYVRGEAVFEIELVWKPLLVNSWVIDRGLKSHAVVGDIHDYLQDGRDDPRAAGTADHKIRLAIFGHDCRGHARQRALSRKANAPPFWTRKSIGWKNAADSGNPGVSTTPTEPIETDETIRQVALGEGQRGGAT